MSSKIPPPLGWVIAIAFVCVFVVIGLAVFVIFEFAMAIIQVVSAFV